MSRPAFLALCLVAVAAGVFVTRWLSNSPPTSDVPLDGGARPGSEDLAGTAPVTLRGEDQGGPRIRGPEAGVDTTMRVAGAVPRDARRPHGLDLTDPTQRRNHLAALLAMAEPDWAEIRLVLAAYGQTPLDPAHRERLLDWFRTGPQRARIVEAMQMLGDPAALGDFVELLDDATLPDDLRHATLRVLATFRGGESDQVALALEARLKGDHRRDVYLLRTIAERGGTEATRILVRYIEARGDASSFDISLIRNYAFANTPEAIEILRDALRTSSSPTVTARLVGALAREGNTALVPSLLELDRDDQDPAVRAEVMRALARVGGDQAIDRLVSSAARGGATGRMALDAITLLPRETTTATGRARIRDLLERASQSDDPDTVRVTALASLGELGDTASMETMVGYAQRGSARVSGAALVALGRLGSAAVGHVDEVAALYAGADETKRFALVRALAGIGGQASERYIRQWMEDDSISNQLRTQMRAAAGRLAQQNGP